MTEYHVPLSEDDDLAVCFNTIRQRCKPAKLTTFSVSYATLVDGEWKEVVRFDNTHDVPHQHIFHIRNQERKILLGCQEDSAIIFPSVLEDVKTNFIKFKQNFLQK